MALPDLVVVLGLVDILEELAMVGLELFQILDAFLGNVLQAVFAGLP